MNVAKRTSFASSFTASDASSRWVEAIGVLATWLAISIDRPQAGQQHRARHHRGDELDQRVAAARIEW